MVQGPLLSRDVLCYHLCYCTQTQWWRLCSDAAALCTYVKCIWIFKMGLMVLLMCTSQVRRHGTSFRRLALLGSDGKQRHFIVQTGQHYSAAVGEHLVWLPHIGLKSMSIVGVTIPCTLPGVPFATTMCLEVTRRSSWKSLLIALVSCAFHEALRCGACDLAGVAGANDERVAHLMRAMNRLLDRHPQSRRRHLAWHTPAIVPVWPQVRGGAPVRAASAVPQAMSATRHRKASRCM